MITKKKYAFLFFITFLKSLGWNQCIEQKRKQYAQKYVSFVKFGTFSRFFDRSQNVDFCVGVTKFWDVNILHFQIRYLESWFVNIVEGFLWTRENGK